jgi:hypothetical protein|nr:MAG TPA: TM2 domain [Caudoviricetes sp.]
MDTKFCKYCGEKILADAIICTKCGRQVEELKQERQNIVINNSNVNNNVNQVAGKAKNKWVSLVLCIFTVCGHKFYEGKIGMGIIYLFTGGLFGIGWLIDIISLLFKPNPYYV